ncbi:MAG: hsp90 co-chaperone Cdc37 [Sclerophora amabilis]|nr:MAG: hsp90 co-chaperone Cdc37 [Sclerophora amabilis]
MSLNYSKWDNLELSDDSDIEEHPNVDKRSFIRAKQNQIHQERLQRKHQIETLKYERIINDGLLLRINKLITALRALEASEGEADGLVFQALIESAGDPADDQPPPRPEGVHAHVKDQPTFSRMMATLVDQVKKEVDASKTEDRYDGFVTGLKQHLAKVEDLQGQLLVKLAELEQEAGRKITSDSIRTGFNSSSVSKGDKKPPPTKPQAEAVKSSELLNPHALKRDPLKHADSISSGAEADIDEGAEDEGKGDDEERIEPSPTGKRFASIKLGDYRSCLQFISENPSVVAERETDGLLLEAFRNQNVGKDELARQCVHQALLLQYCRQLGRDGVGLFFKRITTKGHQAQKVFQDDVNQTYARIRTRSQEMAAETANDPDNSGGVEQIQLHAVEPGTAINIVVPQADSEDPVEKKARETFTSFPPGLRRALETGSLDEVNKVLGKMSVEEAEEVVGQLGEGGMLSLEEQIIDATTEEGQSKLKEIEAHEKEKTQEAGVQLTEDPE